MFSNKVYDVLKFIALVCLPAISCFYLSIAEIWHLPLGQEISGTIMAVDTLLGVILGISSKNYAKKELEK